MNAARVSSRYACANSCGISRARSRPVVTSTGSIGTFFVRALRLKRMSRIIRPASLRIFRRLGLRAHFSASESI
jgi:hypothetical protein